jgi:superfamily II DNA or RNA helicase
VLVITDRVELFRQTMRAINLRGIDTYTFDANAEPTEIKERCIICMVETLKRRADKNPEAFHRAIGEPTLIIIDEAHKGGFNAVFDIWPEARVIGATATPVSTKKDLPLSTWYHDIVNVVDIPALVQEKYLAEARHYAMISINDSALKTSQGEFTTQSLDAVFGDQLLFDGVIDGIREHAQGKKTIVFCPSVLTTKNLHAEMVAKGLRAVYVVSKSSDAERAEAIAAFHGSGADIMVNCGILTTGYDFPPIEVVVMNRATQSLPLWLQCCGRGSRMLPGKTSFKILDYGSNIRRLGLWDSRFPWDTMWSQKPKKKEKNEALMVEANSKKCPSCRLEVHPKVEICPQCGHVFEKEKAEGVLRLVSRQRDINGLRLFDLTPEEMLRICKLKGYKKTFATVTFRAQGPERFLEYAEYRGLSDQYVEDWLQKTDITVANRIVKL